MYVFLRSLFKKIIDPNIINRPKILVIIIFFKLFLNRKININPKINKTNGILFPESKMPVPNTHTVNVVNKNLVIFLSFNKNVMKNIEKKEKFFIYPPAINSSPKKPELCRARPLIPIVFTP